jgi:uncharacterized membrane protein
MQPTQAQAVAALPPPARFARQPARPRRSGNEPRISDQALARGLAWFSIALGLTQAAAPRRLARHLGVDGKHRLIRTLGVRELTSGLGILSQPKRPAAWLWSRVLGDAIDIALLMAALPISRRRGRVATSLAAVGGITVLDVLAGDRWSRHSPTRAEDAPADGSVRVAGSIAVMASADEAYRFWRQLEHLPIFMKHLDLVQETDARHSHWVARAPGGRHVEWNAEITDDVPNERIAWRSTAGSEVENSGTVRFVPDRAGRGSMIEVELRYRPPFGGAGAMLATLFGEEPRQQLAEDLRRLKQMVETGEIATTEGQPSGRMPPAQQAAEQRRARE